MAIQKGPLGNDISSTEIAAGAVTYAKLASDIQRSGMKNRIINGAMMIDQRNAGAAVTVTGGQYPVDRFIGYASTDGTITAQQSSIAPVGFVKSIICTTTVADASLASGQYAVFQQAIEGYNVADLNWGTVNAKPVTLSFWVRSSLTGTFGACITNGDNNRSYPFSYSISSANTWTQISATIPGDTTGTWLTTNGIGLKVYFGLGVGSTYSGAVGSWAGANYLSATGGVSVIGTLNATWYITGVQLEAGSTATNFEYRQYSTELALCQRYYYQNTGGAGEIIVGGVATGGGQSAWTTLNNVVPMRANPTGVLVGGATWDSSNATALVIAAATKYAIRLSVNCIGAGQFYAYNQTAPNGYYLSAEL